MEPGSQEARSGLLQGLSKSPLSSTILLLSWGASFPSLSEHQRLSMCKCLTLVLRPDPDSSGDSWIRPWPGQTEGPSNLKSLGLVLPSWTQRGRQSRAVLGHMRPCLARVHRTHANHLASGRLVGSQCLNAWSHMGLEVGKPEIPSQVDGKFRLHPPHPQPSTVCLSLPFQISLCRSCLAAPIHLPLARFPLNLQPSLNSSHLECSPLSPNWSPASHAAQF